MNQVPLEPFETVWCCYLNDVVLLFDKWENSGDRSRGKCVSTHKLHYVYLAQISKNKSLSQLPLAPKATCFSKLCLVSILAWRKTPEGLPFVITPQWAIYPEPPAPSWHTRFQRITNNNDDNLLSA